jgi:dihydrofolate synthase/folylpolyglutamate synthase
MRSEEKLNPSTFFEAYTAMAYLLFREAEVDVAIMETGLGGRLDSTNTCEPVACAITTLGLDHTEILGDTIEQIAREKAGILKHGVPAVYAPQEPAAEAVLREVAEAVDAPLRPAASADPALAAALPLAGEHQAINLSVALGVVDILREQGWSISGEAVAVGVRQVSLPGRLQIVGERPWVVLDVAHNEPAAKALAATLPGMLKCDKLIAVLGLSAEKDALAFCRELAPLVDVAVLTQANIQRALPAEDLAKITIGLWRESLVTNEVDEALRLARERARPEDCLLITGSFYVVGEAMQALEL